MRLLITLQIDKELNDGQNSENLIKISSSSYSERSFHLYTDIPSEDILRMEHLISGVSHINKSNYINSEYYFIVDERYDRTPVVNRVKMYLESRGHVVTIEDEND